MVQSIPKPFNLLLLLIAFLVIIPAASALTTSNFSTAFPAGDIVRFNTSYVLDRSNATPWELWIASGIIGLILFLLTLKTRLNTSDLEVDAIISVLAWVPIGYCSYASFAVDRLTSWGVTSQFACGGDTTINTFVLLEQHTLYSEPIIGILMAVFFLVAIGNTIRILTMHKLFRGEDRIVDEND